MSESDLNRLLDHLARAAKEVAKGDYHAAGRIFELTKSEKYPVNIADLAEALGMMLVMVEAREERLEQLISDLQQKKFLLERASRILREANIGVLELLGSAIAKRDHDTSYHNYRVALYSINIARAIGHPDKAMRSLVKGSFLHDVGKIGISDNILLKKGKLTEKEFEVMKEHVRHGFEIVSSYPWLSDSVDVVLHHHEKYDGTGYPMGLEGKDIPLNARIFAVADVFDALTSVRPYKAKLPYDRTIDIMKNDSGSHFDPEIFDELRNLGETLYRDVFFADESALRSSLKGRIDEIFLDEEV